MAARIFLYLLLLCCWLKLTPPTCAQIPVYSRTLLRTTILLVPCSFPATYKSGCSLHPKKKPLGPPLSPVAGFSPPLKAKLHCLLPLLSQPSILTKCSTFSMLQAGPLPALIHKPASVPTLMPPLLATLSLPGFCGAPTHCSSQSP